jgi:hypothetical protein
MVRHILGSMLFPDTVEDRKEFKEASWPTMRQHQGNSVRPLREQSHKMDLVLLAIFIDDSCDVSREAVDMFLMLAPLKEYISLRAGGI